MKPAVLLRRRILTVFWIATLLVSAGCSGSGDETESGAKPFQVLFVSGTTGMLANTAKAIERGIRAHIEALNEDGGINGRAIELTVKDNQSDPTRGVTLIQEALSGETAPDLVIPGVSSNEVMAVAPLLTRHKVVGIASSSSQQLDDITEFPYFFSNSVTTDPIVNASMEYILGQNDVEKVVLIVPTDAIGDATIASHKTALKDTDVTLRVSAYKPDAVDVTPAFQKALSEDPDWIIMEGAGSQAATLLSSRVKASAERVPTLAAVVASNQPLLDLAKEGELENIYATMNPLMKFVPEEERGDQFTDFLDRVKAQGKLESPLSIYASGWDYIKIWADAVSTIDGDITGSKTKAAMEAYDWSQDEDPQFPMYSGNYSTESHFHPGPPEDFAFGTPIDMEDGMYVLK